MFIVSWKDATPTDRDEWIAILREVLSAEVGSYVVRFFQAEGGWRFSLDYRPEEERPEDDQVMANSPETVAFNIHQMLSLGGKPIDPTWVP